jgi:hypothetical protein
VRLNEAALVHTPVIAGQQAVRERAHVRSRRAMLRVVYDAACMAALFGFCSTRIGIAVSTPHCPQHDYPPASTYVRTYASGAYERYGASFALKRSATCWSSRESPPEPTISTTAHRMIAWEHELSSAADPTWPIPLRPIPLRPIPLVSTSLAAQPKCLWMGGPLQGSGTIRHCCRSHSH